MDELKRLTELLEKRNDLHFLINLHTQNKERIWGNDTEGYTDYINAALDEINDISKAIKELTSEDL